MVDAGFGALAELPSPHDVAANDAVKHLSGLRRRLLSLAQTLLFVRIHHRRRMLVDYPPAVVTVLLVGLRWGQLRGGPVQLLHGAFNLAPRRVALDQLILAEDRLVATLQVRLRVDC